ncbi:GNAT family N-acetyltransferase [Rhodobacteraceae bacterium W635]|uniref:GNAT family N-acetyltransferase n=1 Tax=Nioella halotolerans TaxID=2303578 RepID=UPI000E3E730C|nr:GNAT family N-acetyltransferase [Rhodobacteraceae bacterium W635]
MEKVTIRPVGAAEMPLLDTALRALSEDLGDPHRADVAALCAAATGPCPAFHALLAVSGDAARGAVLFSPCFSTVRGIAGLYVSDLWVSRAARGTGLGRGLLAAAAARAHRLWNAGYLRLDVYDDSAGAQGFYDRLGLAPMAGQRTLALAGDGFDRLKGEA